MALADGRRVSFASDITGRSEVYTIARQGDGWGKPVRLTRDGGIFPFWSPDGRYIAFSWNKGLELVPADGGEVRPFPLTGPLAWKQMDAYAYAWAPDSRHAYMVFSSDAAPYQTLWSVPVDSGRRPRQHDVLRAAAIRE